MTPRLTCILCATPRSGSTLLCGMLRSSGVAGWPESWFRRQNRAEFAADFGIARPDGSADWPQFLQAAITAGTTPNGVFGLRVMWNMLGELCADLDAPTAADLARTFGPLKFVYLRRRDLVAQAISRHKAEVSGTWHLGYEEAENPVTPHYDHARIAAYLAEAESDNANWHQWFAANAITPLPLMYEDLSIAAAAQVLAHIGPLADNPAPMAIRNIRMADATSAAWAARFRAEKGAK